MKSSILNRIALVLLFLKTIASWPKRFFGRADLLASTHPRTPQVIPRIRLAAEGTGGGKGFGPPPIPPTLEEFVEKEEAKKRSVVKRERYKAAKELAKKQPSLHKMLGSAGEAKIPDQKKQGHGGF